jgi:hypothetical protein
MKPKLAFTCKKCGSHHYLRVVYSPASPASFSFQPRGCRACEHERNARRNQREGNRLLRRAEAYRLRAARMRGPDADLVRRP